VAASRKSLLPSSTHRQASAKARLITTA
jgi:hypothetical protein